MDGREGGRENDWLVGVGYSIEHINKPLIALTTAHRRTQINNEETFPIRWQVISDDVQL